MQLVSLHQQQQMLSSSPIYRLIICYSLKGNWTLNIVLCHEQMRSANACLPYLPSIGDHQHQLWCITIMAVVVTVQITLFVVDSLQMYGYRYRYRCNCERWRWRRGPVNWSVARCLSGSEQRNQLWLWLLINRDKTNNAGDKWGYPQ